MPQFATHISRGDLRPKTHLLKGSAFSHIPALLAFIAIWSCVPTTAAYAYVDPSVMTYTIQAVAGVAVALSAVAGVAFRRTRRKLYQVFNVDENVNKVPEGSVSRIDSDAPDAASKLANASKEAARQAAACEMKLSAGPRNMRWRTRFGFALLTCIFTMFTIFIAPALEVWGSNGDSLVFSLSAVWWIPVVFCLAIALVLAAVLSALKLRAFYTVLVAIFAIGVAAYVQSMFLNNGMMPADGGFIGWSDWFFARKMIISGIIWVVIVTTFIVFSLKHSHTWLKATSAVACALIIMQLVGVGSVALSSAEHAPSDRDKPYVTQEDLLTVSPRSNVIVFVLDTYDTSLLEQVRKENPDFLSDFDDFTYFKNSTGTMIPTVNAIPYLVTGLKPQPGQSISDYRRTKYESSTFLKDIDDLGYSIALYSDSLMMDFSNPADCEAAALTTNVHPVSQAPINIWNTFIAMEQCALYREAPWVLKPCFWYYTSEINNRTIASGGIGNMNDSLYELDDAAILQMVREGGLQATDESPNGAFRFIHLFGPHFPFSVDENGNDVGTNQSDQLAQAKGSMKVVSEYMSQLKSLGLYDEATIIVTADHGIWDLTDDPVSAPISPIMLVKASKPNTGGDDGRADLALSDAPVSHDDLQATVIGAMHGDPSKYGSTFFQIDNPNRVRYFDALTNAGGNGQRFVEYAIAGDVSDIGNWKKTGETWQDK